jgi:hypothetical protein
MAPGSALSKLASLAPNVSMDGHKYNGLALTILNRVPEHNTKSFMRKRQDKLVCPQTGVIPA